MKKNILRKRIGNDVFVRWAVMFPDGSPIDFSSTLSFSLILRHNVINIQYDHSDCDCDGNLLSFHFLAGKQVYAGRYDLFLKFTIPDEAIDGGIATYSIDHCGIFELVDKSCDLVNPGEDPVFIQGVVTALSYSMLSEPEKNEITTRLLESGHFEVDKQVIEEARSAANTARVTNKLVTEKEEARILNEEERKENETSRVSAENGRAESEIGRESAETSRVEAEHIRVQNEYERIEAENNRQGQIDDLYDRVHEIELAQPDKYVASWITEDLNPDSDKQYGDPTVGDCWRPYLVDCTKNSPEDINVVGELKRNNFLRFVDGSFAPVVGITEAMRAECDVELYLEGGVKYSNEGEFNPADFYNEHGMAKLYDSSGNEVRVLRPWETTSQDFTIVLGMVGDRWIIDNVTGRSGKKWKAIFNRPTMWDGIEAKKLARTGFSPGAGTTVGNKMRNFFFLYNPGDANTMSSRGRENIVSMFYREDRCYPRTVNVNQLTNATLARANNSDPAAPLPFSEGGMFAYCALLTSMEVKHRTKHLHNPSLFGSGISSNEACANESQYLSNGGVRYSLDGGMTWNYSRWSESNDLYFNDSGGRTNMNAFVAYEYPKEQCMESQMAASFATELGVSENVEFEMYGEKYWYINVPGVNGLMDGEMNVKIHKIMGEDIIAFDAAGANLPAKLECNLRMSLVDGFSLCGDVLKYVGGGCESIGLTADPVADSTYKVYLETDQSKFIYDSIVTKDDFGVFDAESAYELIGENFRTFNGYRRSMAPYTITGGEQGGSIATGECAYIYGANSWSSVTNRRVRVGLRVGGYAAYTICAARLVLSLHSAATSSRAYAGFAQVRIRSKGASP